MCLLAPTVLQKPHVFHINFGEGIVFIEKVLELKGSRLIQLIRQDGLKITMSFEEGDSGNMRLEYRDIDREALQAFSLTFRMFAEQRDDIALRKLSSIDDKDLSDKWKSAVTQVNQWYSQYIADTSSPTFVIDDEHLSRGDILRTFMYGDLSHVNTRARFENWRNEELMFPLIRNEFYLILMNFVQAVLYLSKLAEEELQRA